MIYSMFLSKTISITVASNDTFEVLRYYLTFHNTTQLFKQPSPFQITPSFRGHVGALNVQISQQVDTQQGCSVVITPHSTLSSHPSRSPRLTLFVLYNGDLQPYLQFATMPRYVGYNLRETVSQ
jgi:hypothetical protein